MTAFTIWEVFRNAPLLVEKSTLIKKRMPPHYTMCLWLVQIGCIIVDSEHHVACSIRDNGVGVCNCLIEKLIVFIHYWIDGEMLTAPSAIASKQLDPINPIINKYNQFLN